MLIVLSIMFPSLELEMSLLTRMSTTIFNKENQCEFLCNNNGFIVYFDIKISIEKERGSIKSSWGPWIKTSHIFSLHIYVLVPMFWFYFYNSEIHNLFYNKILHWGRKTNSEDYTFIIYKIDVSYLNNKMRKNQ